MTAAKQTSLALVLVDFIETHPDLPAATWEIADDGERLRGVLQTTNGMGALAAYAAALNSVSRFRHAFESAGEVLHSHGVTTTHRGLEVEIVAIVPAAESDAWLHDGRTAEQRHQTDDPAEPPLAVAREVAA